MIGRRGCNEKRTRRLTDKPWLCRYMGDHAGYMLRPRYHMDREPSWAGTDMFYLDFEDGQPLKVSVKHFSVSISCFNSPQYRLGMDATRISDGRSVMLKRILEEQELFEVQLNRAFSSDPRASDPRNHCAPLLDVIELPNDPRIMVHSQLRPFYDPPFYTYGEFVAFFEQIWTTHPRYNSAAQQDILYGGYVQVVVGKIQSGLAVGRQPIMVTHQRS